MTRKETVKLLAFLTAAMPHAKIGEGTAEAWHLLLGDLDFAVAQAAASRVLQEHTGAWLPAPALIRQAASALAAPRVPDPDEAWAQVMAAMRRHGWMDPAAAYAEMDPLVAAVVRGLGWRALCEGTTDVTRGQFRMAYTAARDRHQKASGLPPALQDGALAPPAPPALASGAGADRPVIRLDWVRSANPDRVGR